MVDLEYKTKRVVSPFLRHDLCVRWTLRTFLAEEYNYQT